MKRFLTSLLVMMFAWSTASVVAQEKETLVLIDTDMGKIKIKLFNDTPLHRDNFLKHVNEKNYEGVLFHRVIKHFMIQGGDLSSKNATPDQSLGEDSLGYTVPAEFVYPKYFHKRGALAAARTGDDANPEKASSGSQFYIVTGKHYTEMELDKAAVKEGKIFTPEQKAAYMQDGGTPHLDGSYTVFGEVVSGMKVVDKIQEILVNEENRPVKDIKIKSMTVVAK